MSPPAAPAFDSVAAHVAWWAKHSPDAEAVVDGDDPPSRIGYRELDARIVRFAGALAGHGVGPGDRVAMLAPPGLDAIVCLVATASVGAVWCGLDPRLRPAELEERIDDLQPALAFVHARVGSRSYRQEIAAMARHDSIRQVIVIDGDAPSGDAPFDRKAATSAEKIGSLDAFLAVAAVPRSMSAAHDRSREPCLVVYTSGSSGRAKGALLHEAGIVAFCRQQNALWPVAPLRTLNYLPIGHAGSTVDLSLPALVGGGCIVFQRRFDARASLEIVERERITFWASVPSTFLMHLEDAAFATTDLSSVQLIAIEGAPIPERLATALLPIAPIATNYGMSETTSGITAMAPTRSIDSLLASVGTTYPDTELRLAADGEIEVRSPRTCLGYWRNAEASRGAFAADGFFRTGDLGRLDEAGRLVLLGRKKEMFKSGGYNVYPAEVEAVLGAHPGVAEVALVAVPHPVWGEVGVAFVVARDGADGSGLAAGLAAHVGQRLADYKRPKRIEVVAALPRLPIGKVDRAGLRERAQSLP